MIFYHQQWKTVISRQDALQSEKIYHWIIAAKMEEAFHVKI